MNARRLAIWMLVLMGWPAAGAFGQSPGTRRTDPLPPGAPVYGAGAVFRPSPRVAPRGIRRQPTRATRPGPGSTVSDESISRGGIRAASAEVVDGPPPVDPYAGDAWPVTEYPEMCGGSYASGDCEPEVLFAGCARLPWSVGVEFSLLKPQFGSNPAVIELDSDGATFENFTTTSFDYDRRLAPRVWIEALQCHQLGIRAVYWQYDHAAGALSASPSANGFGRVSTPFFGNVNLSTTVPDARINTVADLNAYSIDLEGTKSFDCGAWGWLASAGLRYAAAEQNYLATLQNEAGNTQGTINFVHRIRGIGPTVSLRTQRPFAPQLALFGMARGALLMGDGDSFLEAIEDQDLDAPVTTRSTTDQDDLLPIGEMQVGLQWKPICEGVWHPYLHLALEGQVWSDAGNASSVDGDLGFFGFNVAVGVDW